MDGPIRMGEALGRHWYGPLEVFFRSLTSTLPRFDPSKYGVADYSFYEGYIDFVMAKGNGLKKPVIRVGQGYYGIDPQFKSSSANSKGLFTRDFYWMLDTKQSANGQASACVNALIANGNLDPDSILWADFELAPADAVFLYGFLATVHGLLPNLKLGIYTGYSYWGTYGSTAPQWATYPLWIAWPVDPYREPSPLKPWSTYYYHQWTFAGDGKFYGCQSTGLDLDYRNPAITDVQAVVVSRSLSQFKICLTPSTSDVLPLKTPLQQATENGWEAAMNCGAGFVYTDASHARVKGVSKANCIQYSNDLSFGYFIADSCTWIPFARRMIDQGVINPNLDNVALASWSLLGIKGDTVFLIVTKGREGVYGQTQRGAADYALSLGISECYLMDSGHSSGIEEKGQTLYSEYGEAIPQSVGLQAIGGSMTLQAQELLGKTVTIRSSPQVILGNGTTESIAPHATVDYLEIVDDLQHPGDANYKWLYLSPSRYANYIYPPNGLRFTLLNPPPTPPTGTVVTLKSWDVIVNVNGVDFEFKGP